MNKQTRTKMLVEQRRDEVTFAFLKGATMPELARKYEVATSTISRDLKAVRAVWAERYSDAINLQKAQELAKIDHLERVAWQGYETTADLRYLAEVRWCIEQRCKLYGLYAAEKRDVSGTVKTESSVNFDYSKLSTENIAQLIAIAESVATQDGTSTA